MRPDPRPKAPSGQANAPTALYLTAVTTYAAFLRAVNVGGTGKVSMADLRGLLAGLGYADVRTILQSGNLVFRAKTGTTADLSKRLEKAARERLGLETDVLVRTAGELAQTLAGNPFPDEAERDPAHLVVMFLREAPANDAVAALRAAIAGPERVEARGAHLYAFYPAGIGESRLTNALIERKLGTRGTARNWNTVSKMAAAASGA